MPHALAVYFFVGYNFHYMGYVSSDNIYNLYIASSKWVGKPQNVSFANFSSKTVNGKEKRFYILAPRKMEEIKRKKTKIKWFRILISATHNSAFVNLNTKHH